jgi:hypothetical protein
MKLLTSIMLFAALIIFRPAFSQKKSGEEDAIKKVIEQETRAYNESNVDKWADSWAHESTSYFVYTGPSNSIELIGWEKILKEFKGYMQNPTPIDEEQYKITGRKYDYQFKISGNLASVTCKEGKGNLATRVLEKQSGHWKIVGVTSVSSLSYAFRESVNKLKVFIGKWKIEPASLKFEPAITGFALKKYDFEVRETENGIEMITEQSSSYNNKPYNPPPTHEQILTDYTDNEFKYLSLSKDESGLSYTATGSATLDTAGAIIIKQTFHDKPAATQTTNSMSIDKDGLINGVSRSYNSDGTLTSTVIYKLRRQ